MQFLIELNIVFMKLLYINVCADVGTVLNRHEMRYRPVVRGFSIRWLHWDISLT